MVRLVAGRPGGAACGYLAARARAGAGDGVRQSVLRAWQRLGALRNDLFARGEPTAQALADGLDLLRQTDLRDRLPTLAVPSLWLAGRRDRLVDPRAMRSAAQLAPRAQLQVVEHAGHAPFLTHAATVARALARFLDDTTDTAPTATAPEPSR